MLYVAANRPYLQVVLTGDIVAWRPIDYIEEEYDDSSLNKVAYNQSPWRHVQVFVRNGATHMLEAKPHD